MMMLVEVDAAATPALLAAAWWSARRVFGPPRPGRLARRVRVGGYLAVCALVLVKALVERFAYAAWHGGPWLAGLWVGEVISLAALAVYVAALTRVTAARRPAVSPALPIGIVAGAAAGLVLLVLPPWGDPLHLPGAWLLNDLGRGVGVPLVVVGGIVTGRMAARRASGRGSPLPLADVRARQGVAAGLCAGAVAALVLAVAGDGVAALLPHVTAHFPPVLAHAKRVPQSVVAFDTSLAESAGGYLFPLVFFPILGAGLGAWGGLPTAGQTASGEGGGGGGGGGPYDPAEPPPSPGGRSLDEELEEVLQAAALDAEAASVS